VGAGTLPGSGHFSRSRVTAGEPARVLAGDLAGDLRRQVAELLPEGDADPRVALQHRAADDRRQDVDGVHLEARDHAEEDPAMKRRWSPTASALGCALLGPLLFPALPGADTLSESNVDTRVHLWFRVNQAPTGICRAVAVAVPAKHGQTGEPRLSVVGGCSSHHDGLPGAYKNYVKAAGRREQTLNGENLEQGAATEAWEVRSDRAPMRLRLACRRGTRARAKGESKADSAVEPRFFRIYRVDQGVDVVKSVPAGVDRVRSCGFRAAGSEPGKLLDGSEQPVGILANPWFVRQVFLP